MGRFSSEEVKQSLWTQLRVAFAALLFKIETSCRNRDLMAMQPMASLDGIMGWYLYYWKPLTWSLQDRWQTKHPREAQIADEEKGCNTVGHTKIQNKIDEESTRALTELRIVLLGSRLYTVVLCLALILAIAALTQLFSKRDLILCMTGFAMLCAILLSQGRASRTEVLTATAG
jgi:hypothetical protein